MSMVIIIDIPLIITTTYWTLIIDGVQCILHIFSFFSLPTYLWGKYSVIPIFQKRKRPEPWHVNLPWIMWSVRDGARFKLSKSDSLAGTFGHFLSQSQKDFRWFPDTYRKTRFRVMKLGKEKRRTWQRQCNHGSTYMPEAGHNWTLKALRFPHNEEKNMITCHSIRTV